VLERASGDHDYNASDHGHDGSAATASDANDDDNNAHGEQRLLSRLLSPGPCEPSPGLEDGSEVNRPQAGGYSFNHRQFFSATPLRFALPLPRLG
jgi:hypothetical protein